LETRVDEGGLDEMQAKNERKKMDFEDSLKQAVALGWVCEGYVDMVGITDPKMTGSLQVI